MKEKILKLASIMDVDEPPPEMEPIKEEAKWDVESILSTHTNTDNHPGVITEVVRVRDKIRPHFDINAHRREVKGGYIEEELGEGEESEDEA